MTIQLLPPNTLPCSFAGGARLASFRGFPPRDTYAEEWVASTTSRWSEDTVGRSMLKDGRHLSAAVDDDPALWVGPGYLTGSGIPMLVKLLESGQRLPVHTHPDEAFARQHLDSKFGKTEAWLVLQAAPGARAYVGWRHDVDRTWVSDKIRSQDAVAMLDAMNSISLAAGDTVLVPGSTVHAFDAGILIAEVEEPTDFSFLFEYAAFGVSEGRATLGLSWDQVLDASNLRATTQDQLGELLGHVDLTASEDRLVRSTQSCADSYFVGWVASVRARLAGPPGLAIGIVISGDAEAMCVHAATPLSTGDTFVVPFACSPWELRGNAVVALYEPPVFARHAVVPA